MTITTRYMHSRNHEQIKKINRITSVYKIYFEGQILHCNENNFL